MRANKGKTLLVLALVGVVGMAFRVSWNALRDVARAIGADGAAATLYPFVVDGLMALALVATLVLTVDKDRKFALKVLAGYTVASLVLNYVHGLVPALHNAAGGHHQLANWGPANWALVLLATSLPVGSIYFGSDLVAKVLHHKPANQDVSSDERMKRLGSEQPVPAPEPAPADPAPVADQSTPTPPPVRLLEPAPVEPTERPEKAAVAAAQSGPRRATGRVPKSARTRRPNRTPKQLLDEAREATDDWSDAELTADAIRKAVRTGLDKARVVRDTLKAERAEQAATADLADTEAPASLASVAS